MQVGLEIEPRRHRTTMTSMLPFIGVPATEAAYRGRAGFHTGLCHDSMPYVCIPRLRNGSFLGRALAFTRTLRKPPTFSDAS